MNYIFDIDGTLTPSRGLIDASFEKYFYDWMCDKIDRGDSVFFITGSDKDKTIEQIGEKIWRKATRCYQSCGNAVYVKGELVYQLDFPLSYELNKLLSVFLENSPWYGSYTNNLEERIGLINFSTLGRNCPQDARENYYEWDKMANEREKFCDEIMKRFPEIEASVGGQISIDIHPKGKNKAQILHYVKGPVTFFGDKCREGGNDYPIVEYLREEHLTDEAREYTIHEVKGWKDTQEKLRAIDTKIAQQSMAPNGNKIEL
jgi:phosphomannomutase